MMISRRVPFKARPRDERAHDLIEQYLDTHGLASGVYAPLALSGAVELQSGLYDDPAAAVEDRRCLFRGARHYGVSAHVVVKDGPTWGTGFLTFALFDKATARQHVLQQTGGDPANLAYNPFESGGPRGRRSG